VQRFERDMITWPTCKTRLNEGNVRIPSLFVVMLAKRIRERHIVCYVGVSLISAGQASARAVVSAEIIEMVGDEGGPQALITVRRLNGFQLVFRAHQVVSAGAMRPGANSLAY
jgi:hypothetical protein